MAADEPLSVDRLLGLFQPGELDLEAGRQLIREALRELGEASAGHGYELKRVASGFRFQVRGELSDWISRLWDGRPPRYSRALLETLALIAYKQPVTRGDIEQVRGVAVSQGIVRTLLDRGWVRIVGQRETPGRPNLYGTTRTFLDYFNLKSLNQLPPLAEIKAIIEPLGGEAEAAPTQESLGWQGEEAAAAPPSTQEEVRAQEKAPAQEVAGLVGQPAEVARPLAEVVLLPTAPRQTGTPREQ